MIVGTVAAIFLISIILYYIIGYLFGTKDQMKMVIPGVLNGNESGAQYNQSASTMNQIAGANEYSFCFWLYLNEYDGKKHVLLDRSSGSLYNPVVYIPDGTTGGNEVVVSLTNTDGEELHCKVPMVSMQRWNCFIVNVFSNSINVYLNGRLFRSCTLTRTDGFMANMKPFPAVDSGLIVKPEHLNGKMASTFFKNTPMTIDQINAIYQAGPNAGSSGLLYRLFGIKEVRVVFEDSS